MHFHYQKCSSYGWAKWNSLCCLFWAYKMILSKCVKALFRLTLFRVNIQSQDRLSILPYFLILSNGNQWPWDTAGFSSALGIIKNRFNVRLWSGVQNISKPLTNQWCFNVSGYSVEERPNFLVILDQREFTYLWKKGERAIVGRHIVKGYPGIFPCGLTSQGSGRVSFLYQDVNVISLLNAVIKNSSWLYKLNHPFFL